MTTICKFFRVTPNILRTTPLKGLAQVFCYSSGAGVNGNSFDGLNFSAFFPWMTSCCSPDDPYNPSSPTMYDCRKYGHQLPANNVETPFEPLPCLPTGLFRDTDGEMLGPGADKCGWYKNAEYFCFHHMSFYDFNVVMLPARQPNPDTGRKPL